MLAISASVLDPQHFLLKQGHSYPIPPPTSRHLLEDNFPDRDTSAIATCSFMVPFAVCIVFLQIFATYMMPRDWLAVRPALLNISSRRARGDVLFRVLPLLLQKILSKECVNCTQERILSTSAVCVSIDPQKTKWVRKIRKRSFPKLFCWCLITQPCLPSCRILEIQNWDLCFWFNSSLLDDREPDLRY